MLEDHLEHDESIIFRTEIRGYPFKGSKYDELAITNKRFVFYKRKGIVFKKDNSASVGLNRVDGISFQERGVLRKKGTLIINFGQKNPLEIEGNPSEIKFIHQKLISSM